MDPDSRRLTGRQIAAGRTLLGIGQEELAAMANISAPTLRRMELTDGPAPGLLNNALAVRSALEAAGAVFLADGETATGGMGVRLKPKGRRPKP